MITLKTGMQQKKKKRHKEVTPEELNKLEDDKDEIKTKKTKTWADKTLRDFPADKDMDINFESYTAPALNDILRLFDGVEYVSLAHNPHTLSNFTINGNVAFHFN